MPSISWMVQSPLALWGLLALLIPLAIHLLSKSRAQLVPFAHLALISVKTSPRLRQLRITQWLLLFLRALLLLIATLLLAELYWQSPQSPNNNNHILLTEDWLNHASDAEREQLVQQYTNATLTLLGRPNRLISKQQIAQWQKPNPALEPAAKAMNLWEKVAEFSAHLSSPFAVTVYSTNRLSQFLGHKQAITNKVNWQIKSLTRADAQSSIQATILVVFDEASSPTLPYLKSAFAALNTSAQLDLTVQYSDLPKLSVNQTEDLTADVILNIAHGDLPEGVISKHTALFTHQQLTELQQPDFPFVLFDLLFTQQLQGWRFHNARLSEQQITMPIQVSSALAKGSKPDFAQAQPLHLWLILLLVMVFAAERLLSEWRATNYNIVVDS